MKTYTRSFAGGEIAELLYGRLDLAKNQTGLARCLNFEVTPQGPIENRAGFEYMLKTKLASQAVLIPFTYNADQSFALEFGHQYIRFHTQGGTLLEASKAITAITQANPGMFTIVGHGYANGDWVFLGSIGGMTSLTGRWGIVANATANTFTLTDLFGAAISTASLAAYTGGGTASRVYEIATPYDAADLYDLHYVQSADVLTITHQEYAIRELRRLGATNWQLSTPSFAPTISTPATPSLAAGGPGGGTPKTLSYVTTAIAADTLEESLASTAVSTSIDLGVSGNYVDITPAATANAVRYNVYKRIGNGGLYSYIGQTDGTTFRDSNIVPDESQTPPLAANPFAQGRISAVAVTAGGAGYGSVPQTGGVIDSVTVTNGGSGYTVAPTVTAAGGGSGATFTAVLTGDAVTSVTITNGGSLYSSPTLSFSGGGGGSGATATATATPIVNHTVTLSVSGGGGSGAVLEPVIVGGVFTGVRVSNGGSGYTAPVVTVTDAAGGAGATFSASITGSDVYPQAVSYFEQRRCFGGSLSLPQHVLTTRSGTESNMTYSIPTRDDDAITARIVAREAQVVRHLVPLNDLLALTSGGVWRISPASGDPLTPASVSAKAQSYVGASMVQPVVAIDSVLYAPERGSHIREVSYKWESQNYQSQDVAVLAPHLFDFKAILQLAYSRTPYQVLWAVRDDGVLLGLTHQPEHEVKAWHQHTTRDGDTFESVCAIPEGDEDGIYAIVQRSINGQTVQYIERRHSRMIATLADAFFVDAGATYEGAAATTITGLWHLEGEEVTILADGGVEPMQTVANGTITLGRAASKVHVGLGYNADAQTLPIAQEGVAAFGQGSAKNVSEVWLRVKESSGIQAGPSFERLRLLASRSMTDDPGNAPARLSGVYPIKIDGKWQQDGSVCVRQSAPLPLTIQSLVLDVANGG